MKSIFATVLASLLMNANAFTASTVLPPRSMTAQRVAPLQVGLSAEELNSILSEGSECVEGECSLDEVSDLILKLESQQSQIKERLSTIDKMIKSLVILNDADDRQVDEVRETVRAIFRIFALGDKMSGNDYPKMQSKPTGWTGDVG